MDASQLANTMLAMSLGQSNQKDPFDVLKLILLMWATSYIRTVLDYLIQWVDYKLTQVLRYFKHPGAEKRYDSIIQSSSSNMVMREYSSHLYLPDGLLLYIYKQQYNTQKVLYSKMIRTEENYIVCVKIPFDQELVLKDDLYFKIEVQITPCNKIKDNMMVQEYTHFISARVYTKHHYFDYIDSFITEWTTIYDDILTKNRIRNIEKLIVPKKEGSQERDTEIYHFISSKTFDNLFFEEKETIMSRLDLFSKKEAEYKRLGLPYNLGFLFHGAAGTGKTSCIKAMANYLGRDIFLINLALVKTNKKLLDILQTSTQRRLFVFEEVDCCGDLLLDRSNLSNLWNDSKEKTSLQTTNLENDCLTLGSILEILDGLVEQPGRICIFTTNYPDRLDKALLRPGRIDMVVEFKKMRKLDVKNMYHLWFGNEISPKVYDKMKDYMFSQAELGKLFQEYQEKPKQLLSLLK